MWMGKIIVPPEVIEEGVNHWQNSVVAQFIGKIPNFSYFQRVVNVLWGVNGEVNVKSAGATLFII